jgi:hypothetical protein
VFIATEKNRGKIWLQNNASVSFIFIIIIIIIIAHFFSSYIIHFVANNVHKKPIIIFNENIKCITNETCKSALMRSWKSPLCISRSLHSENCLHFNSSCDNKTRTVDEMKKKKVIVILTFLWNCSAILLACKMREKKNPKINDALYLDIWTTIEIKKRENNNFFSAFIQWRNF